MRHVSDTSRHIKLSFKWLISKDASEVQISFSKAGKKVTNDNLGNGQEKKPCKSCSEAERCSFDSLLRHVTRRGSNKQEYTCRFSFSQQEETATPGVP
jgi:hypothetical protein